VEDRILDGVAGSAAEPSLSDCDGQAVPDPHRMMLSRHTNLQ
jgi:hypothetical protein